MQEQRGLSAICRNHGEVNENLTSKSDIDYLL